MIRIVFLWMATIATVTFAGPAMAGLDAKKIASANLSNKSVMDAAQAGDFDAQVRAGYALLGIDPIEGVKQDISTARFWFSRAMAQRQKARKIRLDRSMADTARDLESGVLKDRTGNVSAVKVVGAEILEWYKLAAALGDDAPGYKVAHVYETGSKDKTVKPDSALATEWYEWSARQGPIGIYGAARWHGFLGNVGRALYWRDHGQLALDRGITKVRFRLYEEKIRDYADLMYYVATSAMAKLAPEPLPGWKAAKGIYLVKGRGGKLVRRGKGAGDKVEGGFYFENARSQAVLTFGLIWHDKKEIETIRGIVNNPKTPAVSKAIFPIQGFPAVPIISGGRLRGYSMLVENWLMVSAIMTKSSATEERDGKTALAYLQNTDLTSITRALKRHGLFHKRSDGTWIKRSPPADRITGTWRGTYVCSQGLTSTDVYLHDMGGGRIGGRFWFSAHPTNPTTPPGGLTIRGRYDPQSGALSFDPVEWISALENFEAGNVPGTVTFGKSGKGTFRGRVGLDGCGEITLSQQ